MYRAYMPTLKRPHPARPKVWRSWAQLDGEVDVKMILVMWEYADNSD